MNSYRAYWNERQINDKRLFTGALAAINGVISSALSGKLPTESSVLDSFKMNLIPRMVQTFKNGAINALQSTEKMWGDTLPSLKPIVKGKSIQSLAKGISVSDLTSLGIPNDKKIIQTQCMSQITTMSTTLHGELKKQFSESITLGETQSELIARIQGIQEQAKWKARRIAQTEATRLYNGGSMIGYRKSTIVTEKQWIANIMGNVRPAHLEAHEQKVRIDRKFFVMDEYLDFPGDPVGSASNVINCHCGISPVIGKVPRVIPEVKPVIPKVPKVPNGLGELPKKQKLAYENALNLTNPGDVNSIVVLSHDEFMGIAGVNPGDVAFYNSADKKIFVNALKIQMAPDTVLAHEVGHALVERLMDTPSGDKLMGLWDTVSNSLSGAQKFYPSEGVSELFAIMVVDKRRFYRIMGRKNGDSFIKIITQR